MTTLKRPNRPAPVQPGPAPSPELLGEFAKHADQKRMEAGDCKVTASTAAEAARNAQANADQIGEQLRPLIAEVERLRQVFDEQIADADRHRAVAYEHEQRAARLLADVAYLDEVAARASIPARGPVCSCTIPGAPDAAERAAACPIHGTPPAERDDGQEPVR